MTTKTKKKTKKKIPRDPVPISYWGRDHWATFAYIEIRRIDYRGVPDLDHMRVDTNRHPQFANRASFSPGGGPVEDGSIKGTFLKSGSQLADHDDWDCVDDLIAEDLLEWVGTGMNPVFVLTKKGWRVISELRQHKASGGQFSQFTTSEEALNGGA